MKYDDYSSQQHGLVMLLMFMFMLFILLVIFRYRGTVASRPSVNATMAEALESLYTTEYVTTALHAKSSTVACAI